MLQTSDAQAFIDQLRRSKNTKESYSQTLRVYQRWDPSGQPPSDYEAVQSFIDYLDEEGKAPATLNNRVAALTAYLTWKGVAEKKIFHTPVHSQAPDYLSKEELAKFLTFCLTPQEDAFIQILYYTGCRIRELLDLRVKDVDREEGLIRVTRKGGLVQWTPLTPMGERAMDSWFEYRVGKGQLLWYPWSYHMVRMIFKRMSNNFGRYVRPHMLRHSRAMHMLEDKLDPTVVRDLLGHEKLATTMDIYGRHTPGDLRDKLRKEGNGAENVG